MLTVRLCHFWLSSGLHKEENLQKYVFPDFSWAGNFAFGIAAAALDGFSLVPCKRDMWKFLTILHWVLTTELKLLDSGNDWWVSTFNRRKKCTFLTSDGLKENLNTQVPEKKTKTKTKPATNLTKFHHFHTSFTPGGLESWFQSVYLLPSSAFARPSLQNTPADSFLSEAGQSRSYEEDGTTWQNMAPGILHLRFSDTPDFSLKACFPDWQRCAAPACRNTPQILALLLGNLEALFYEEPFPSLHWGKKARQSQTKLFFIAWALQVTQPRAGTHRHSPARAVLVCAQTSTAPGNPRRKGPHNCHLSIFIKNLP